jgi:hypothetical protein
MADYTRTVNGGTGVMLIRDQGGWVEFHITAGNGSAYDYNLGWAWYANGTSGGGTFRYNAGAGWQYLGAVWVGSSQNVTFHKNDSGSIGLGGATDFTVWIQRSTVPPAPTPVQFSLITHTSVRTTFSGQGDGGSGILEWQLAFGTNGGAQEGAGNTLYSSSGTNNISGLKPGRYHAAWARGRNANGWGPWSAGNAFDTLGGAFVKEDGVQKDAVPYVKVAGVWVPAVPYVKVNGVWKNTKTT